MNKHDYENIQPIQVIGKVRGMLHSVMIHKTRSGCHFCVCVGEGVYILNDMEELRDIQDEFIIKLASYLKTQEFLSSLNINGLSDLDKVELTLEKIESGKVKVTSTLTTSILI